MTAMRTPDPCATDDRLMQHAAPIDWHAISEQEAAQFGLAVGMHRDACEDWARRRVAWKTCSSSVLSMLVLASFTLLCTRSASAALIVIVVSQTLRATVLWSKQRAAHRGALALEADALQSADALVQKQAATGS